MTVESTYIRKHKRHSVTRKITYVQPTEKTRHRKLRTTQTMTNKDNFKKP